MSKKLLSFFVALVVYFGASHDVSGTRDTVKRVFEAGDYDAVRQLLPNPINQFAVGQNADVGEMFYLIASSSPKLTFDVELDKVTAAIDMNAAALAVAARNTYAEKLWGFIKAPDPAGEKRDDTLAKLVEGLLHLNVFGGATPVNADPATGLKLVTEAATQGKSKHAAYWLGFIYQQGFATVPVDPSKVTPNFKLAGEHVQAKSALTVMGIAPDVVIDMSRAGDVYEDDDGTMQLGRATREGFVRDVMIPAYRRDLENYAYWRRTCLTCSNVWEATSVLCAGAVTAFSFAAKYDDRFAIVGGVVGIAGLVFKGFAHHASGEAKEKSQNLADLQHELGMEQLSIVSNASVDG